MPESCKMPSFGYRCKHAFEKLGYEINVFNYRKFQLHRSSYTNDYMNKLLLKKALKLNPDMMFVGKGEKINTGIIEKISNSGIKTVNWYLDDPFGTINKENKITNLSEYDYSLLFDSYYVDKVKESGQPNAYYLPIGVDPQLHKEIVPIKKRKHKYSVSFVGSHCKSRETFLENISDYPLDIWGYRFQKISKKLSIHKKVHRKIYHANKYMSHMNKTCEIFNLSKINLNIHHPHTKESVNLRAFEIPATKSFQLSDYFKDMKNMFKLKKEIICYEDEKDLRELLDYYLENEEERNKISIAGYKRVIKDHTFIHRFKEMFEKIKI